jgi:RimJ/RimL family protein N-acetyltransferase
MSFLPVNSSKVREECTGPLEGKYIRLERQDASRDYQQLYEISHGTAEKEVVWQWINIETYKKPFKDAETYREFLKGHTSDPNWIAFTIVDKKSNRRIGAINVHSIVPYHRRAEIGGIWIGREFHGTYAVKESCLLLLYYLFENLNYRRAEWKTNSNNIASQKIALKLGYSYEGTFRNHMFTNGVNRDTMYFGMTDTDWNEKKVKLFELLGYTKEDEDNLLKYKVKASENL